MSVASAITVLEVRAELGESPVWDPVAGVLWFVDIEGRAVVRLEPVTGAVRRWTMPDKPGCLALCASGRLLVGMSGALHLFTPASGALERFVDVEVDRPGNRLNDAKTAPDGAFWVGSMNDTGAFTPTGALYRVTADGRVEKKRDGLIVSNGLAWSADGAMMFHSDSRGRWIRRFRHATGTGALSEESLIAEPDDATGRPDGAATDVEGNYWSAGVSAGCLNRWSRDGALLERIELPVPNPTMPCFCGDDLRTVYVTSLVRTPHVDAGALVKLRSAVAGVPVARFPL
jgi:sugar lactone lactonase YvrE